MKGNKLIITAFFLIFFSGPGRAQKGDSSAPFFFIQISDPQFGMFESNNGFAKETELYEKAVREVNRLKPDFVVITGDLVNSKDDIKQIAEFKRISAKIDSEIPVYYSPGNHDIGQAPASQDIDTFVAAYGNDRFSFMHKKSLFIGLNSSLIKSKTPILEEIQYRWLKRELKKGKKAENVILFCHYPFFINSADETETYSNIANETRARYLELFKEYNVNAVFAGHLHNNALAKWGNMDMITTSAVGKPLAKVPSGMRIVIVTPEKTDSQYYGLDDIPASIVLQE